MTLTLTLHTALHYLVQIVAPLLEDMRAARQLSNQAALKTSGIISQLAVLMALETRMVVA